MELGRCSFNIIIVLFITTNHGNIKLGCPDLGPDPVPIVLSPNTRKENDLLSVVGKKILSISENSFLKFKSNFFLKKIASLNIFLIEVSFFFLMNACNCR